MPVVRKRVLAISNLMHMRASGRRPGENSSGAQAGAGRQATPPEVRLRNLLDPTHLAAAPPLCDVEADHEALMAEGLPSASANDGRRQLASGALATGAAVIALYGHEADPEAAVDDCGQFGCMARPGASCDTL